MAGRYNNNVRTGLRHSPLRRRVSGGHGNLLTVRFGGTRTGTPDLPSTLSSIGVISGLILWCQGAWRGTLRVFSVGCPQRGTSGVGGEQWAVVRPGRRWPAGGTRCRPRTVLNESAQASAVESTCGRHRHGHAVFVEVGDGSVLRRVPPQSISARAVSRNVSSICDNSDPAWSLPPKGVDWAHANVTPFRESIMLGIVPKYLRFCSG